ncbi:unnamed protein product [Cylicostephanus goldi]|uniref:Uncharacterized protein n=1 Tax=Cylicostephanus goldi TaxID=71465 RepID=A0A3P6R4N9_CYLGO|nr:unnamed protein product [Cylicostephanus goldi]
MKIHCHRITYPGQTLSESDFCDRLSDLLSNERPLWNYIRQWLPLPYEESVTPADFEFIDLRKRTEAESAQDDGAECIDDMNAVLGILPPRKGGLLQVAGGQLNYLQNGSYVPVLVTKESEELGENKEPQKFVRTVFGESFRCFIGFCFLGGFAQA